MDVHKSLSGSSLCATLLLAAHRATRHLVGLFAASTARRLARSFLYGRHSRLDVLSDGEGCGLLLQTFRPGFSFISLSSLFWISFLSIPRNIAISRKLFNIAQTSAQPLPEALPDFYEVKWERIIHKKRAILIVGGRGNFRPGQLEAGLLRLRRFNY